MSPALTRETQAGPAMIGDASPFTGNGVDFAMFDAGMGCETGACLRVGRTFHGIDPGLDIEPVTA